MFLKIYKKFVKKTSKGYGLSKNPLVKKIMNSVESNLKSDFAEIQGSKMYLDQNDSLRLSIDGVYGELDTLTMKQHIKNNDIVIDVGANIGYYTLLFSRLTENHGRVFGFEPEPNNFELLRKNTEINNYDNVTLEQKAVSKNPGIINLYLAKNGIVGHRIYDSDICSGSIEVEMISLDDYFSKLNLIDKINFIKIDVEGAELGVFHGMEKILHESENLKIFSEFNRNVIENEGSNPKEILEILNQYNFTINYIDNKQNLVRKITPNELMTSNNIIEENVNILCTK